MYPISAQLCSSNLDSRSVFLIQCHSSAFPPTIRASRRPMLFANFEVFMPLVHLKGIGNCAVFNCTGEQKSLTSGIQTTKTKTPFGPLQLESSEGQALREILLNRGHVLQAASRQLRHLAAEWQRACTYDAERKATTEDKLYRGAVTLTEKERARVVQEIMYVLVVARLVEANWTMVLPTAFAAWERKSEFVPGKEKKLQESLHAPEAQELIEKHVEMVIGGRKAAIQGYRSDPDAWASICKLRMGKIYAASAMYGYYLKRIEQRFRLERQVMRGEESGGQAWDLKAYVGSLDRETQRFHGRVRGEESLEVIERHVAALLGNPAKVVSPSTTLQLKVGALRALLREALAFGSALWDVEGFVASSYPLSIID